VVISEPRRESVSATKLRSLLQPQVLRLARRVRDESRLLVPEARAISRILGSERAPAPDEFAAFGKRSWIVPPAKVVDAQHVDVGADVVIMEYSRLEVLGAQGTSPVLRIGSGVRLARFNTIICGLEIDIGPDVASSDCVAIFDTWADPRWSPSTTTEWPLSASARVVIGAGSYLGFGCVVCPGVRIGEGAFVGEGAVVTEDVPAHTVVSGNPATVTRRSDGSSGAS
jgi:acetyltransferase-like isoleucine patch superfamily enzyme